MAGKMTSSLAITITVLFVIPLVFSDDRVPIPADKSQVSSWFHNNVKPYAARKGTLDPALEAAEAGKRVIKVRADGSGDFKTVNAAVNSIPKGNTKRVIVWIGGGIYNEKIWIDRDKPFITFCGAPNAVPTLVFAGTAAKFGTVNSATLIVESNYFSAVNIIFKNSAPRPDGKRPGAQASAMRIGGDKASFYNCKFHGFQDTLCDDKGKHFFKDCYIEGTVDFIFGNGKSLYLNVESHVIPGDPVAMITAQARELASGQEGYSFVHGSVTGAGGNTFLGRAWKPFARVVYSYTEMSNVVNPKGWSDNFHPENDKNIFFGEYNCKGPGSNLAHREGFTKKLTDATAKPFITLAFIEGSKWLLPPTTL